MRQVVKVKVELVCDMHFPGWGTKLKKSKFFAFYTEKGKTKLLCADKADAKSDEVPRTGSMQEKWNTEATEFQKTLVLQNEHTQGSTASSKRVCWNFPIITNTTGKSCSKHI